MSPSDITRLIGVVEGRSLWRLAPEHVDLVAKNQDLRFTPCAGLDQPNKRTTKQSEQVDHWAPASPDSPQFASCMEFPTGTCGAQRTTMPPGEPRVALICLRLTSRNVPREQGVAACNRKSEWLAFIQYCPKASTHSIATPRRRVGGCTNVRPQPSLRKCVDLTQP